jgi:uncharacterized protein YjbJ (UPF0337 family)
MTNEKIQGQWDQTKGAVKEGVGNAIDDPKMENEGKLDKATGTVEKGAGEVKEQAEKTTDDLKNMTR